MTAQRRESAATDSNLSNDPVEGNTPPASAKVKPIGNATITLTEVSHYLIMVNDQPKLIIT